MVGSQSNTQWLGGDEIDMDDDVNALEDPFVPNDMSAEPMEYDETEDVNPSGVVAPMDSLESMGGRRLLIPTKKAPKKTRKTRKTKGKKSTKRKTTKSKKRKSLRKPKKSRKSRRSRRSRRSRSRGGRMWANLSRAGESTNASMGLYKADAAGVIRPVAVTPVYNVKHT